MQFCDILPELAGFARLPRVRSRYPFDALHWLRHQKLDEQAAAVAERATRTARARVEEARAQATRRNTELQIDEVSRAEQTRLEDGQVTVGELQAVAEWRKGANADLLAKAEREAQAREARVGEASAEAEARRALGSVSNEAKMIDSHRTTFRARARAARERSDEEAATEQWTAQRFPRRG